MTFTGNVKSAGVAALLTIAALGLAGCGKRGNLQNPGAPSATAAATPASSTGTNADDAAVKSQSGTPAVAPNRDFLLDPLL